VCLSLSSEPVLCVYIDV